MQTCRAMRRVDVSIHAPREGCDGILGQLYGFHIMFQFTHPGRGATSGWSCCKDDAYSFNSRTPGGVRPLVCFVHAVKLGVSIHAPREGCDISPPMCCPSCVTFQFTHPGRGATRPR